MIWFKLSTAISECRADELLMQNHVQSESNGCSKPSFIQVQGEEDFTYCCDRHDACYSTCGISKDYCEKDFKKCMKSMCQTVFAKNKECNQAADVYVMGTSMFGSNGYAESQNLHCSCIKKDDMMNHYKDIITKFYNTYAPAKLETFMSTFQLKYTSIQKLRNLYYRLMKTYDASIKHVEDRAGKSIPIPPSKEEL